MNIGFWFRSQFLMLFFSLHTITFQVEWAWATLSKSDSEFDTEERLMTWEIFLPRSKPINFRVGTNFSLFPVYYSVTCAKTQMSHDLISVDWWKTAKKRWNERGKHVYFRGIRMEYINVETKSSSIAYWSPLNINNPKSNLHTLHATFYHFYFRCACA